MHSYPLKIYQHPDDEKWMTVALMLARLGEQQGEVPVGAVIVCQGQVLGTGYNQPISTADPTAHAEIMAIRAACAKTGNYRLPADSVLYVTLEPCTMCTGALVHARLGRVVFATHEPRAGALVSQLQLGSFQHFNHQFEIGQGVLMGPASRMLRTFFRNRRKAVQ